MGNHTLATTCNVLIYIYTPAAPMNRSFRYILSCLLRLRCVFLAMHPIFVGSLVRLFCFRCERVEMYKHDASFVIFVPLHFADHVHVEDDRVRSRRSQIRRRRKRGEFSETVYGDACDDTEGGQVFCLFGFLWLSGVSSPNICSVVWLDNIFRVIYLQYVVCGIFRRSAIASLFYLFQFWGAA